ncbi:MAG TPA: RNA 2',3'-cyclic phosphodiesterase [Gemmatimonadaceae bacterium]|jgi:2'-5' RNA ligase|nr:RNA 2',3'-cyclic phosphodiesterase [Gemmatimonadaceae bacterium]
MDAKPERLFIGVPVTEAARRSIVMALPGNLPGKPVPPENWHFTLRFLGSTPATTRDRIVGLLRSATCGAPFSIRFSSLGAFPRPNRARILWLGIDEGAERMIQLAAIAEATARVAGFAAESKPFKPHLTLARIDSPVSVSALVTASPRFGNRMIVDSLILYRSRLGRGPARYEEVERIRLGR